MSRDLIERIEQFLMERKVLAEHTRDLNERLQRGEMVLWSAAPVAPIEYGFDLLEQCRTHIETLERRLAHSEFHRTCNRRRMRRLGKYQGVLEAKILRQRAALKQVQGRQT